MTGERKHGFGQVLTDFSSSLTYTADHGDDGGEGMEPCPLCRCRPFVYGDPVTMSDALCSRFVRRSDACSSHFIYPLPATWWSRGYEYAWAAGFAEPGDIALDAASGIEHPLKFHLLDHCRRCHACDVDRRIVSPGAIREALGDIWGRSTPAPPPDRYLYDIDYCRARLEELPYPDGKFDKIYCISVLEHLPDRFNRSRVLRPLRRVLPFAARKMAQAMAEFHRTLKDGGLLVLTLDYPRIDLEYFLLVVAETGFSFCGPVERDLPGDALYSEKHQLYCFRALLRKEGGEAALLP